MNSAGEKFKEVLEALESKPDQSVPRDETEIFATMMIDSLELAKELARKGARGEQMTPTEIQYIKSFTLFFALSIRI